MVASQFFARVDVVEALLDRGADANAKDNSGRTALMVTTNAKLEPYWLGQARDHDSR
jgi:ankyrin repeat protein